jgi:methylenetetrahydrofolate dehydrogenase (NADP+)/methenyltetrahydrofolate cyclohydrolase
VAVTEPKILEGRRPAQEVASALAARVRALGRAPRLAIVRLGEDPRSAAYIRRKQKFGAEIGVEVTLLTLPESSSQQELEAAVSRAGHDSENDGVLLQLPAAELNGYAAAALVPAEKDVDGLVPGSAFQSATALAVLRLLEAHGVAIAGRRVAVVGQSRLVGAPFSALARVAGANVSTADISTADLGAVTRAAEIVVSAVGKPGLLAPGMLAPDATVIDVGTTPGPDGALLGDLSPEAASAVAAYSPVPGGVGPMTVAALFANLLQAAERRAVV